MLKKQKAVFTRDSLFNNSFCFCYFFNCASAALMILSLALETS